MDKKRLKPREMTVANVRYFVQGYPEETVHGLQQILMAFGVAPKMERILWATLKKAHIYRTADAERKRELFIKLKHKRSGVDREVVDYDALDRAPVTIVGICPRCDGTVRGTTIASCETKLSGRVFYKECEDCIYYSETFKIDNKYREVEGGT